ncbi:Rho termination factor domain-containing protein, partial [bacterium]|nr:Rho termination factor domain-containing protein [bacterium]
GLASMGSNGGRPQPVREEDFWLVVNTELIVYGATEPDAKVIIQGEPLRLNHDGTFSVRYALPRGRQIINVRAVNAAGTQERENTPVIEKLTK